MRDYTTKNINFSPIGRKKIINNGILYAGGNDSSTGYGAIYTYSNIGGTPMWLEIESQLGISSYSAPINAVVAPH